MSENQNTKNITLIYIGEIQYKGDHEYKVTATGSDQIDLGQKIIFKKKVLPMIPIGAVVTCESESGVSFSGFQYAEKEIQAATQKQYDDQISEWSAKCRARIQLDAVAIEGKKEHPKHISKIITELAKACRGMSTREKTAILFFITSKILK